MHNLQKRRKMTLYTGVLGKATFNLRKKCLLKPSQLSLDHVVCRDVALQIPL